MTKQIVLVLGALFLAVGAYSAGSKVATSRAVQSGLPNGATTSSRIERVRVALGEPDAIVRIQELTSALENVKEDELLEIVTVFEDRFGNTPPRASSIELLGETWAALDPEGAIERMNLWPNESRQTGIGSVSRAWARREGMKAYTWAQTLEQDDRAKTMDAVFRGWAEGDNRRVWDVLAGLTPGLDRESATNIVMNVIIRDAGFDGLLNQVEAIRTGYAPGSPQDFKLSALRTAIGLYAGHDPERALIRARRYAGGPYDSGLLRRVAIFWVAADPDQAMRTFVDLPPGPERDKALHDGYLKWIRTKGASAIDWMPAEAASDPRYKPIVGTYAIALARRPKHDPIVQVKEAARWTDSVADETLRRTVSIQLGAIWIQLDPENAQRWIDDRDLGSDVEAAKRHAREVQKAGRATAGKGPGTP